MFFTLSMFGITVRGEAQTDCSSIQMRQHKAKCWYSGESWIIKYVVRIDIQERRVCVIFGVVEFTLVEKR